MNPQGWYCLFHIFSTLNLSLSLKRKCRIFGWESGSLWVNLHRSFKTLRPSTAFFLLLILSDLPSTDWGADPSYLPHGTSYLMHEYSIRSGSSLRAAASLISESWSQTVLKLLVQRWSCSSRGPGMMFIPTTRAHCAACSCINLYSTLLFQRDSSERVKEHLRTKERNESAQRPARGARSLN